MKINEIKFGSLFKIGFLIGFTSWVMFGLILFLLTFIAPEAVTINSEVAKGPADGLKGLMLSIIVGALASALVSATGAGLIRLLGKKISFGSIVTETAP